VKSVEQRVIHVELAEGVEGFIRAADIKRERVEDARTEMKEGDDVEARFISVDRKSRVLGLSIKAKEQYEEDQAMRDYGRQDEEPVGATTMGDLLKQIRSGDE
jgi:small subunit ribosomal protein S1